MKCPYCGKENEGTPKFCTLCGSAMPAAQSQPQPQPQIQQPQQPNFAAGQTPQPPQKEPFYKATWFIILMLIFFFPVGIVLMWMHKESWKMPVKIIITAFFALCMLGAIFGGSDENSEESSTVIETTTAETKEAEETTETTTEAATTEATTEATTAETTEDVTEPVQEATESNEAESNVSLGMENALEAAINYIKYAPFSYDGLIDQLEYEGYTHEEAVYGADNCAADWNEQAAKAAKNYIDLMSFSRQELIDQLIYEGYTPEQAEYGAQSVGY